MENISRRDLVGAAAMGAGALFVGSVVNVNDANAELVISEDELALELPTPDSTDPLLNELLAESEVEGDLTLPDGRVIKAVYIRLRNRLNRIGKGVGSEVHENCWDFLEYLYSEEDAEHVLEMPMFKLFSIYDYKCASGRSLQECEEILDDLANRGLLWRFTRAEVKFYEIMPHLNGLFEVGELDRYRHGTEEDLLKFFETTLNVLGNDQSPAQFSGTFPLLHSYPISKDVIAEDEFMPYMDWSAIIERNPIICRSPCQCRVMWNTLGENQCDHLLNTCLMFGETAQYFLDLDLGEQLTQEEAMESMYAAIDNGLVPTSVSHQDSDIICCCGGDCCINLNIFKSVEGKGEAWKNYSGYIMDYDKEKCIQCGACAQRCPMEAISFDEDGFCIHNQLCVRCGHCVAVCPADARILHARESYPALPKDYTDLQVYFAKDRLQHGYVYDFTGTEL